MAKKRERLEVIHDILTVIRENNNSIKHTPLLRFSNLSLIRFSSYYDELIDKKFIKELYDKKDKKFITLTDKGFKYLEKYKLIVQFVDDFEL